VPDTLAPTIVVLQHLVTWGESEFDSCLFNWRFRAIWRRFIWICERPLPINIQIPRKQPFFGFSKTSPIYSFQPFWDSWRATDPKNIPPEFKVQK
jgi:hypothetical protein